jgi:chorismate mutase
MKNLAIMREEIDSLDRQLIALLGKRFQLTEQVGMYKAECALSATDLEREKSQYAAFKELAIHHGVSEGLVEGIYKSIIKEVVHRHKKLIN